MRIKRVAPRRKTHRPTRRRYPAEIVPVQKASNATNGDRQSRAARKRIEVSPAVLSHHPPIDKHCAEQTHVSAPRGCALQAPPIMKWHDPAFAVNDEVVEARAQQEPQRTNDYNAGGARRRDRRRSGSPSEQPDLDKKSQGVKRVIRRHQHMQVTESPRPERSDQVVAHCLPSKSSAAPPRCI